MITLISLEELIFITKQFHIPVTAHSKKISKGCIFVALPPSLPQHKLYTSQGGEQFIDEVVNAGAGFLVIGKEHSALVDALPLSEIKVVLCDSPREALGELASAYYGTDENCPEVVGITGTNGKTTTAYLLEHIFTALGKTVGILGTVEYRWPNNVISAPLTTPGCIELHSMLSKMNEAGVDKVFMEVSSHALDQERVASIPFAGALFTNLTQDHLDYHADMEDYYSAKAKLFRDPANGGVPLSGKAGAVNTDDPYGYRLVSENPALIGFGLHDNKHSNTRYVKGSIKELSQKGMTLCMSFEGKTWEVHSKLVGTFNAMNLIGVQALGLAMGLSIEDFSVLSSFAGVPGRLERVPSLKGLHAFVDYAHTPDALIKVQSALKEAGFKRIITVFGCGGNRDKTKRPLMGSAVANLSDIAVLTSDNPRHEDPLAIMADVRPGLADCQEVYEEPDRCLAIKKAVSLLREGDALLVAGKGHETYQQVGDEKKPFSDQLVLKEFL